MSNQLVTQEQYTQAYDLLHENVHSRAFFGKLASYGIVPQTEDEANEFFKIAAHLDDADFGEKQASAGNRFSAASHGLEGVYNDTPGAQQQRQAAEYQSVKQAAHELQKHDDIYDAVLTLKLAEAQLAAT